jgi:hypothetical protein
MTTSAPTTQALSNGALRVLRRRLRGMLVQPGDALYDEHRRVWNGSIDRRPALIARCDGAADVAAALDFAREHERLVAVRAGGHSFSGQSVCDGGVVIDLSPLRAITVDPEARTARVQAGVLLGELDAATQPFGLAVPAGVVSHTGVAGLTLGGGLGWLLRKYGLSVDQLLSVDLVTADGDRVRATEGRNSDLFWGVRGGGGNFGIVTEFCFRLKPVGPTVLAGPVFWPIAQAHEVMRCYRDWITGVPDELMTGLVLRRAPALPIIPTELHGQLVVGVVSCYAGDVEEGEKVVRPMRRFGSPALDLCRPKPYVEHQAMFDPSFPHGRWYHVRACDVAELNDNIVDTSIEYAERIASPHSGVVMWQMGGAMARVGEHETAFGLRREGHALNITGATETAEGFDAEREWVRGFWSALSPHHTSVYVNFLMDEGAARVGQAYPAATYSRLRALKGKYDPDNVFRLNQNIPPA